MKRIQVLSTLVIFLIGCTSTEIRVHASEVNEGRENGLEVLYYNGEEFSGIVYQNWENGNINYIYEVKNGLRHGSFKGYWENGQIHTDTFYKNGLKHGEYKGYWNNGNPSTTTTYVEGERHGGYTFHDYSGELVSQSTYQHGVKLN